MIRITNVITLSTQLLIAMEYGNDYHLRNGCR